MYRLLSERLRNNRFNLYCLKAQITYTDVLTTFIVQKPGILNEISTFKSNDFLSHNDTNVKKKQKTIPE